MKPYPPLGLLYLSAFLKRAGILGRGVRQHVRASASRLAQRFARRARRHGRHLHQPHDAAHRAATSSAPRNSIGWTVMLGGPESANYIAEYLERRRRRHRHRRRRGDDRRAAAGACRVGAARLHGVPASRFATRPAPSCAPRRARRYRTSTPLPFPDREAIDHGCISTPGRRITARAASTSSPRAAAPTAATGARTPCTGIRTVGAAPPTSPTKCSGSSIATIPTRSGTPTTCSPSAIPWLDSYAAELKRRGIHRPFETITRADRLQNEGAVQLLQQLGCYRIWIGSESGSQRILDAMQRGVSVEQVRRSVHAGAGARHPGRHVPDVGLRRRGARGHRRHRRAREAQQSRRLLHDRRPIPSRAPATSRRCATRVELPIAWAEASDRDYVVAGRRGKDYYKLADQWLRSEVEASRVEPRDPLRAAELLNTARQAQAAMQTWGAA